MGWTVKLVEFTRDMAPHNAGDSRLVPDALAEALAKAGDVTNVREWPEVGSATETETETETEQHRWKRHERRHK